jgi:hypothetical protein
LESILGLLKCLKIWALFFTPLSQPVDIVPEARGVGERANTRSYYAILDISTLSVDDTNLLHTLSVQNTQGATNYTFRVEVMGKSSLELLNICD